MVLRHSPAHGTSHHLTFRPCFRNQARMAIGLLRMPKFEPLDMVLSSKSVHGFNLSFFAEARALGNPSARPRIPPHTPSATFLTWCTHMG